MNYYKIKILFIIYIMSNFNVFTIPQLKKICIKTGISQFIKFSVTKPEFIQQIEKYLEFDGYNFTIKSTNEQKFLKSDLLKKNNKSTITAQDKKILKMIKDEIRDLKEILKNSDELKKLNILTNSLKESVAHPSLSKGTTKKIKINKIKKDFNKLIEEQIPTHRSSVGTTHRSPVGTPTDWKDIYQQYKLDSDTAIKDAKKLNPKFNAKDAFEINQEYVKIFINKYGIAPNIFLHENRLKYDKKYKENYYNQLKKMLQN